MRPNAYLPRTRTPLPRNSTRCTRHASSRDTTPSATTSPAQIPTAPSDVWNPSTYATGAPTQNPKHELHIALGDHFVYFGKADTFKLAQGVRRIEKPGNEHT
jgi:hypothetical protein